MKKDSAKRELLNDVMTGLMVAGTFAAIAPSDAMAQLTTVASDASTTIMGPFVQFAAWIAYALGVILVVSGIAACKRHADNPNNDKLAPALGRLGAGAAFLVAPSVGNMLQSTGSATGLTGTTTISTFAN